MHTHSQRLEKWLGTELVENLSKSMRSWYGPPIAIADVPGVVYATGGGDFIGEYRGSAQLDGLSWAVETAKRALRQRFWRKHPFQNGAFAGLAALVTAQNTGKACVMPFSKNGAGVSAGAGSVDFWTLGAYPVPGAVGGAAPAGTVPTNASTGAMNFQNAVATANSSRLVRVQTIVGIAQNSLLLYDRLFSVAKTMVLTTTEAVTGVPTRYTSQTATAEDYIGGNFVFPNAVTGALAATAHNWTVCQYTNQAGTTGQSIPSIAGISACPVRQIDLALGNWFMPLAAGDVGVKALTQMQCDAAVATTAVDFVIGHPIAIVACSGVAQSMAIADGVTSAFNLQKVYDNACLALMDLFKPSASSCFYTGFAMTVSE